MNEEVGVLKPRIVTKHTRRSGCMVSAQRIETMINKTAPQLLQKIAKDGHVLFAKAGSGLYEVALVRKWMANPCEARLANAVLSGVLRLRDEKTRKALDELAATGFASCPILPLPEPEAQLWERIVSLVTYMPADVALLIDVLEERVITQFDPFITARMLEAKGWSLS
jgi:hypothetical protein